jgi:hypothetical protein
MYELRIDQIQILDELQSRASTDWKHVDELVELLQSGGQFKDHPVVFRQRPDGDEYFLADGFHRVHAYLKAGIESAMFDVRAGGTTAFRLAKLWSIQSNITHGLRRSNADKRRAVEMLLADEEWSAKSDRWIAETAGVSHHTVANVKQLGKLPSSPVSGGESPEFKQGLDGKLRPTQKRPSLKKSDPELYCEMCNKWFRESQNDCPRCFPPEPETVGFIQAEDPEFEVTFAMVCGSFQRRIFDARTQWTPDQVKRLKTEINTFFSCDVPSEYREAL